MATLEKRFEWLKEVLAEPPQGFADYYKDDIANFLNTELINSDELEVLFNRKFQSFKECETKEDVRKFVSKITSFIVMTSQIEELIADYFS